jgi:sugar phosphate isomerase/epimerase
MKIGMVTDSLGHLSFDDMLDTAAKLGIQGVEFNAANWTSAPHLNLKSLLSDSSTRKTFVAAVKKRNLEIIALNANGNQLHPT